MRDAPAGSATDNPPPDRRPRIGDTIARHIPRGKSHHPEDVGGEALARRHRSQHHHLSRRLARGDAAGRRPSTPRPAIVEHDRQTRVDERPTAVAAHGRTGGAQRRQVDPTSGARHHPHRGRRPPAPADRPTSPPESPERRAARSPIACRALDANPWSTDAVRAPPAAAARTRSAGGRRPDSAAAHTAPRAVPARMRSETVRRPGSEHVPTSRPQSGSPLRDGHVRRRPRGRRAQGRLRTSRRPTSSTCPPWHRAERRPPPPSHPWPATWAATPARYRPPMPGNRSS